MFKNDDRDVKIFGKKSSETQQDSEKALLRDIDEQHQNGNMALAKSLGRQLADELLSANSASALGCGNGEDEDIDVSFQRRVLLAFCVEVGLDIYVPNDVVSSAANNEFNKYLEEEYPDFYKRVMDMGAFSLYYLSLRTNDKADVAIGEVFSKLCTGEIQEFYTTLGQSLFACFMGAIEQKINSMGFVGFEDNANSEMLIKERD